MHPHHRLVRVLDQINPTVTCLDPVDEHWYWIGRPKDGKTRLRFDGKEVPAPRWLWQVILKDPLDGVAVHRWCSEPGCVNPAHHSLSPAPANYTALAARHPSMNRKRCLRATFWEWSGSVRLPILWWDRRSACVST